MSSIAGLFNSAKEYTEPVLGEVVEGSIPTWLEGTVLRVGPGVFDLDGGFTVNFYQDGFSVLSKIDIRDGKASFTQRILQSDAYKRAKINKKPVYAEFGTRAYPDMAKNFLKRMFTTLVPTDLTDNNVGNVYLLENEVIVASETCFVHSVDPATLVEKEKIDYSKFIPGVMLLTPHPETDSDGITWNIGAAAMPTCKYHVIKIPPTGDAKQSLREAKIIATIDSQSSTHLTYHHSFAITQNYVIFMEQPLTMSIVKMAQMGIKGNSVKNSFEWHPEQKNRIYIIEKATGNVLKTQYVTNAAYFVLHFVNAFEENDQVVIDMLTYPSAKVLDKVELNKLRNNQYEGDEPSQVNRFVLPVIWDVKHVGENMNLVNSNSPYTSLALTVRKADKIICTPQPIADPGIELPAVNPKNVGLPYRYFYGSGIYVPHGIYKNAICKVDTVTMDVKVLQTGDSNEFFGEVYVIPKGPDADEDDVVVLSCVATSDPAKPDYVLLLDGGNMDTIAKINFEPAKFSQTLHGRFLKR